MTVLWAIFLLCFLIPISLRLLKYYLGPVTSAVSLKELGKEMVPEEILGFLAENEYNALIVDARGNVFDVLGFASAPNRKIKRKMSADCREIIQDPTNDVRHMAWKLYPRSYWSEDELLRGVMETSQLARDLAALERRGE